MHHHRSLNHLNVLFLEEEFLPMISDATYFENEEVKLDEEVTSLQIKWTFKSDGFWEWSVQSTKRILRKSYNVQW